MESAFENFCLRHGAVTVSAFHEPPDACWKIPGSRSITPSRAHWRLQNYRFRHAMQIQSQIPIQRPRTGKWLRAGTRGSKPGPPSTASFHKCHGGLAAAARCSTQRTVPPATGKGTQACSEGHCGLDEKFTFLPFTAEKQTFQVAIRKSSYAREGHHVLSQLFDWQRFIYHSFYCSNGSW
jgi:hypothetical protein